VAPKEEGAGEAAQPSSGEGVFFGQRKVLPGNLQKLDLQRNAATDRSELEYLDKVSPQRTK